jgi:hypothetical protein
MNMVNDTKVNDTMGNTIIELHHNDLIILNGRKGYVGTVRGYAKPYPENSINAKYNRDPEIEFQKAITRKEDLYWINQEAGMLCGDKGYYESYKAKWANAINLVDGQIVKIESDLLKVHYKGNYSDMANFIKC